MFHWMWFYIWAIMSLIEFQVEAVQKFFKIFNKAECFLDEPCLWMIYFFCLNILKYFHEQNFLRFQILRVTFCEGFVYFIKVELLFVHLFNVKVNFIVLGTDICLLSGEKITIYKLIREERLFCDKRKIFYKIVYDCIFQCRSSYSFWLWYHFSMVLNIYLSRHMCVPLGNWVLIINLYFFNPCLYHLRKFCLPPWDSHIWF